MWPFRLFKRRDKSNLPPEVEKFYQSEKRERVGLAWLIAFVTLVLTVALIVGLFFGGRWAYRKVAGPNPQPAKPVQPAGPNKPVGIPGPSDKSTGKTLQPAAPAPSQSVAESSLSATNQSQSSSQTHVRRTSSSSLSNTGPGDTVALFVAVSLLGTLAHSLYLRRKTSD